MHRGRPRFEIEEGEGSWINLHQQCHVARGRAATWCTGGKRACVREPKPASGRESGLAVHASTSKIHNF